MGWDPVWAKSKRLPRPQWKTLPALCAHYDTLDYCICTKAAQGLFLLPPSALSVKKPQACPISTYHLAAAASSCVRVYLDTGNLRLS